MNDNGWKRKRERFPVFLILILCIESAAGMAQVVTSSGAGQDREE